MGDDAWQKVVRDDLQWIRNHIVDMRADIAGLKVKSGVWGFLAGLIPSVTLVILTWIEFKK